MYNLIIIGAGPAGLTASIYASRYKLSHLVIGAFPGGLAGTAHKICNFPSEKEISGQELISKIQNQAEALGGEILIDEVNEIKKKDSHFLVQTKENREFNSKTILLATGTKRKKLGLKDEDKYLGEGISYCATCDGFFYKDKIVAVIGGGDAGTTASLLLANIAKKVYQIFLEDRLHGEVAWIDQVLANPKIKIIPNNKIIALGGEDKLEKIILDKPFEENEELPPSASLRVALHLRGEEKNKELKVDGVFVEIGSFPETNLSKQLGIKINKAGYIIVNQNQSTNVPNVWAAGDITTGSNEFRQIITACSEGAVAVENIYKSLIRI